MTTMEKNIKLYYNILKQLTEEIIVTRNNTKVDLCRGVEAAAGLIKECKIKKKKLIFIGNGASAAIASHMAVDFWKNCSIKAIAFNDAALLTCLANDYGYDFVFDKSINVFGEKGDILISISSSGRSKNILKATKTALAKGLKVITLSGFKPDNPLRRLGEVNFYVPAPNYGHVEVLHHSICHCLVDVLMKRK